MPMTPLGVGHSRIFRILITSVHLKIKVAATTANIAPIEGQLRLLVQDGKVHTDHLQDEDLQTGDRIARFLGDLPRMGVRVQGWEVRHHLVLDEAIAGRLQMGGTWVPARLRH